MNLFLDFSLYFQLLKSQLAETKHKAELLEQSLRVIAQENHDLETKKITKSSISTNVNNNTNSNTTTTSNNTIHSNVNASSACSSKNLRNDSPSLESAKNSTEDESALNEANNDSDNEYEEFFDIGKLN